eukprot:scaffold1595_cov171-Amphora_coffeaeformis.AAC.18
MFWVGDLALGWQPQIALKTLKRKVENGPAASVNHTVLYCCTAGKHQPLRASGPRIHHQRCTLSCRVHACHKIEEFEKNAGATIDPPVSHANPQSLRPQTFFSSAGFQQKNFQQIAFGLAVRTPWKGIPPILDYSG